jgi:hypothetical protein
MRYLSIPKDVKITQPSGQEFSISFAEFLRQIVWDEFRKKDFDLFDSAAEKFVGAKPGAVVELTDAEHEKMDQIVGAAQLGDPLSFRPFLRAVKKASNKAA